MIVSEPEVVAQPQQAVPIDEGISGTSTFKGEPLRGGWIPVYTKYHFGAPIVTDWICPKCTILISQSRTCPHCGLERLGIPIYKDLSRPRREHLSNVKSWMEQILDPEEDDDGQHRLRRGCQKDGKHSSSAQGRASKGSRNRRLSISED
jgi:hypothetical protein